MSSALTKSPPPKSALSRPSKVTCLAEFVTWARARMSFSGTPVQRALPIAPLADWPPVTRGSKKPRLLPEHWFTATISTGLNCDFRSASVSVSGMPAALPPTLMTCVSASMDVGMPAL